MLPTRENREDSGGGGLALGASGPGAGDDAAVAGTEMLSAAPIDLT